MAEHSKLLIPKLGILLVLFVVGTLVGGVVSEALYPDGLKASEFCEQDECDDGWFGGSCEDNVGHNTGCNKTHKSLWFDGCETYVCGPS